MADNPTSWLDQNFITALVSAIFGGAGLKVVEKILNRKTEESVQATVFRDELRKQVADLRAEVQTLKDEIDQHREEADLWRLKYWEQVSVSNQHIAEVGQLRLEINSLKERLQISDEPHI